MAAMEHVPQHMTALAGANRTRLARAALKRQIADGTLDPVNVILDPPREARTMTVMALLRAQHRWETARAKRFLRTVEFRGVPVPIVENKTLGSMTTRQRTAVAMTLRENLAPAREITPHADAVMRVDHGVDLVRWGFSYAVAARMAGCSPSGIWKRLQHERAAGRDA